MTSQGSAHGRFTRAIEQRNLLAECTTEVGDIIWADDRRKLRVFDVVSVEEEESPFVDFLQVESA